MTQLELLTTEESLITIDTSVAAADAALIQDQIALFRALGGGLWGNYSAVIAGLTIVERGSVAYLKNDKGVVIKLHSQTGGLRFNLSANGMHHAPTTLTSPQDGGGLRPVRPGNTSQMSQVQQLRRG